MESGLIPAAVLLGEAIAAEDRTLAGRLEGNAAGFTAFGTDGLEQRFLSPVVKVSLGRVASVGGKTPVGSETSFRRFMGRLFDQDLQISIYRFQLRFDTF